MSKDSLLGCTYHYTKNIIRSWAGQGKYCMACSPQKKNQYNILPNIGSNSMMVILLHSGTSNKIDS
jgi:hypothetical protein